MSGEYLISEVTNDGAVGRLTLNNPPLNVMSIEMMDEINSALLALREDADIKVLVLRGQGRAFSAGIDVSEHTRDKITRLLQVFHRIFETIRLLDVISVAAVDGVAAAGGFELAIGCNLVVASESARFSLPEVRHGVFPPVACVILPRAAPRRKAMEWILLGEQVSADELATYGLVNRVFPDDEFDAGLEAFVEKLAANSGPVMKLARQAQYLTYYATYEEALYKVENLYMRELMSLSDSHEGITAFLDKRDPQWRDV
ncbi:MAG TPA: enoyl-CoA hydratase/isomerase family protein [Gemmatimonadales bacterium]